MKPKHRVDKSKTTFNFITKMQSNNLKNLLEYFILLISEANSLTNTTPPPGVDWFQKRSSTSFNTNIC